ncbi:helix-turn-helix transcriptional regulator [Cohaesibacter celericrescens]|uniref:HTH luxR-type domain-containing protein n=1 Tax=Cohaesibacter celericrescens TaxID=2067669 RepID=A0A2N5XWZ5_9HYPH|nr:LuxR C-terminal-related transcriptional regulator [Cohaesibacter celericrescens]PLW79009.1 hypothetical protein C0081_01880 [Cohaesibacter celericrescens]
MRQIEELKNLLTLATQDAQHWDQVCNCVVDLFGALGAILVPTNPSFRGVWMSCSTSLGATLPEYIAGGWHMKDPREQVMPLMIERGYATDDDIFDSREIKAETPFYKEFLFRHDFGVLIAIRLLTPNGYWGLMLHFDNDHPPISDAEKALILEVRPLFEQAIATAEKIAYQRIAKFAQFFKGTGSEVFIFDGGGEQCIDIDTAGSIKKQHQLSSLLPDEMSSSLHQELAEVCTSDASLSLSRAYQFRAQNKLYNILIIQAPPKLRHFFMPFKVCAIRTECSDTSAVKQKKLRDGYGLSEGEIVTVDLLASGKTPAMIAEIMSLKSTSVRQRLKGIYEKTNVNSQVELIALYGGL